MPSQGFHGDHPDTSAGAGSIVGACGDRDACKPAPADAGARALPGGRPSPPASPVVALLPHPSGVRSRPTCWRWQYRELTPADLQQLSQLEAQAAAGGFTCQGGPSQVVLPRRRSDWGYADACPAVFAGWFEWWQRGW